MSETFQAILVSKPDGGAQSCQFVDLRDEDLMAGDVTIAVEHSSVNFKDGLAITGKSPILRRFPMIPGIDFAGKVIGSENPRFLPGDRVLLNGFGVGEVHHGGFAQRARVKGDWLVAMPGDITTKQAMGIGTAGYTAALCVMALEQGGLTPESGDILVTGAAGGVGSVAISLLDKLGYRVVASSRRAAVEERYLRMLGAADVIDAAELAGAGRPLLKERWAGAVDSVGSVTLANVIAGACYGGVVAACGLAQGPDLPATVMPFILRGVTLAGVDSVMAPMPKREAAWALLAAKMDFERLDRITTVVGLRDVSRVAEEILAGQVRGRVVINL